MPRHVYTSAHDWLNSKINWLEADGNTVELANMFRSLLSGGVDNDMIQNAFEQEMDGDGFFYDLEESPIEKADPSNWSIADCQWFLDNRLGIDLNTVEIESDEPETDIEAWKSYTAARIEDYGEDQ